MEVTFESFSSTPWAITLGLWAIRCFGFYLIIIAVLAVIKGESRRLFFTRPTRESIDPVKDSRSFLSWRYEQTGDYVSRTDTPSKFWILVSIQVASGIFILFMF